MLDLPFGSCVPPPCSLMGRPLPSPLCSYPTFRCAVMCLAAVEHPQPRKPAPTPGFPPLSYLCLRLPLTAMGRSTMPARATPSGSPSPACLRESVLELLVACCWAAECLLDSACMQACQVDTRMHT